MTQPCNIAIKNGRIKSKKNIDDIASGIGISARHMRRLESGKIKEIKDDIAARAVDETNDFNIGTSYLNENAVFIKFFGVLKTTDAIHAAVRYIKENREDKEFISEIEEFGLSNGMIPLSEKAEKEIKETLDALMDLWIKNLEAKKERARFTVGNAQTQ